MSQTGVLPDDIIIGGKIYPDQRGLHSADLNQNLINHTSTVSRAVFYFQWALANSGFYTGPIDGKVGPTNDLINAATNLYNSQYSGQGSPPGSYGVPVNLFRSIIRDQSSVDINLYKVVD